MVMVMGWVMVVVVMPWLGGRRDLRKARREFVEGCCSRIGRVRSPSYEEFIV